MDEQEIEEIVCTNAILAAVQLIQDKCGGKKPKIIELDKGIMVFIPNPIATTVSDNLTCEEKVLAVAQSDWALGVAKGLATKLFGLKPGQPGYEEAVKRAAIRVAIGATNCYGVDIDELLKKWTEPIP